ncbi:peptidoglycan recognition protein [Streptomyces sp. NPDC005925]|uniref:peptidoglycan recognition protein family protein n=1 Tax=Streptomyces sp. NPDC005925 TaxID=3157172 RepID=UPI0033D87FDE
MCGHERRGKAPPTGALFRRDGAARLAGPAERADSGTMRVVRSARGVRPSRAGRIPGLSRPVPAALCLLLGLVAAAVLVLGAGGFGRHPPAAPPGTGRPATAPYRAAAPYQAARPHIVPRSAWLGDAARPQPRPRYDDRVLAVFVHHTDTPNGYDCADTPRILRGLYTGQTGARDWDDIGYNFVVDRCGTIYEGRAGGVTRAVTGAHTQGFNHRTAGIAALGTFTAGVPVPQEIVDAIAAVAAWKLGPSGTDPRATVDLVSSNGHSRYAVGATVSLPAVAGHDDGFRTSCPGAELSARLPTIRGLAAQLQGRK